MQPIGQTSPGSNHPWGEQRWAAHKVMYWGIPRMAVRHLIGTSLHPLGAWTPTHRYGGVTYL